MSPAILFILLGLVLTGCAFFRACLKPAPVRHWACYYGSDSAMLALLPGYDLVVVEPDHPGVVPPQKIKTIYAAYVSIGEAEKYRWYWPDIDKMGILIGENKAWKNDWMVDIRKPEWQEYLMTRIIPKILAKGYRALFFDTIDGAYFREQEDPKRWAGSTDSLVAFIKKVRKAFPELYLIANNGLPFLSRTAPYINALVVESLNTTYDFTEKKYGMTPALLRDQRLKWLRDAGRAMKNKPVLIIDYASPGQADLIAYSKSECAKQGFVPFNTEIGLNILPSRVTP